MAAIIHIGIPETKRNVQNEIPRPHFRYRPTPIKNIFKENIANAIVLISLCYS